MLRHPHFAPLGKTALKHADAHRAVPPGTVGFQSGQPFCPSGNPGQVGFGDSGKRQTDPGTCVGHKQEQPVGAGGGGSEIGPRQIKQQLPVRPGKHPVLFDVPYVVDRLSPGNLLFGDGLNLSKNQRRTKQRSSRVHAAQLGFFSTQDHQEIDRVQMRRLEFETLGPSRVVALVLRVVRAESSVHDQSVTEKTGSRSVGPFDALPCPGPCSGFGQQRQGVDGNVGFEHQTHLVGPRRSHRQRQVS
mmetsp:Transcript_4045/g.6256  ORF Transcript_4045/g.6256 Transcript_4045/m.6256 type:complete len:245 (-) Transcript_4045:829-1563(-)